MQRFENSFSYSETRGGLNYPGNYFITNSKNPAFVDGGISSSKKFNSLYASADLSYKNMLYLQATWRGDWSSALTYTDGTGNNFYNYPAVSLSWIFTESFRPFPLLSAMESSEQMWHGWVRIPILLQSIPAFAFNGFSSANGGTVPTSTFSSSSVLQDNLKPSRKFSRELGLEMRFLQSRIGFDFTVYQDNTKNQILEIAAPIESGVTSILINAGNIQNKGIELSIDATPISYIKFQLEYCTKLIQGTGIRSLNSTLAEQNISFPAPMLAKSVPGQLLVEHMEPAEH